MRAVPPRERSSSAGPDAEGSAATPLDPRADVVAWAQQRWADQGLVNAGHLGLFASVGRLDQLMTSAAEAVLKPFGLGLNRYFVLNTLLLTDSGARPMNRLGWHLLVHPTTVTVVVDRLEADGLVQRVPHPTDRRTTLVSITEEGRALGRRASEALAEQRFGLPELDPSQLDELLELLTVARRLAGDVHPSDRG